MLSLTKVSFINMGFSPSQWALLSMFKTEVLTFRFGFQAGVSSTRHQIYKIGSNRNSILGSLIASINREKRQLWERGQG